MRTNSGRTVLLEDGRGPHISNNRIKERFLSKKKRFCIVFKTIFMKMNGINLLTYNEIPYFFSETV